MFTARYALSPYITQIRFVFKGLKDTEIMRIYEGQIRKGIYENSDQQSNQNEETSHIKWENTKKVVTAVVSEVVGYEGRKEGEEWLVR